MESSQRDETDITTIRQKEQILDAAAEIFNRKGLAGVSMVEIAKAAGIPENTLYKYFPTKEALSIAVEVYIFRTVDQ